jgi:hypothetical protein
MSDSDDDYCYVGAEDTIVAEESGLAANNGPSVKNGKSVQGKDIVWFEYNCFDATSDFNASEFCSSLKKDFTMKMARELDYADTETSVCKFAMPPKI